MGRAQTTMAPALPPCGRRAPRPPPVPPVPQLEPVTLSDEPCEDLALVIDTGMASVKVHVHVHVYAYYMSPYTDIIYFCIVYKYNVYMHVLYI